MKTYNPVKKPLKMGKGGTGEEWGDRDIKKSLI